MDHALETETINHWRELGWISEVIGGMTILQNVESLIVDEAVLGGGGTIQVLVGLFCHTHGTYHCLRKMLDGVDWEFEDPTFHKLLVNGVLDKRDIVACLQHHWLGIGGLLATVDGVGRLDRGCGLV
jgi:hypothetical protein